MCSTTDYQDHLKSEELKITEEKQQDKMKKEVYLMSENF